MVRIALISLLLLAGAAQACLASIVPPERRISDDQARLTLAWLLTDSDSPADLQDAHDLLVELRRKDPGNRDVMAVYVPLLLRLGQTQQALELAHSLYEMQPDAPEAALLLADAHAALGHYARTRELYRQTRSAQPKDLELRLRHTDRRNLWGDFYTVENELRMLLQQTETPDEQAELSREALLLRLARALYSQQQHEKALELLRRLQHDSIHPQHRLWRETLLLHLDILVEQKNFPAALDVADQALRTDPDFTAADIVRARILMRQGFHEEAAQAFQDIADRADNPGLRSQSLTEGARALLLTDERDHAARLLQQARVLAPHAPLPKLLLHVADTESIQQALAALPEAMAMDLALLGQALAADGRIQQATAVLQEALKRDPDCFPVALALARTRASDNRYEEALRHLARLREQFPESESLLLTEARVLAWSKDYDASLERYAELRRRNPRDSVPLREAGRTAYWGKDPFMGSVAYNELYADDVDSRLQERIPGIQAMTDLPAVPSPRPWGEPSEAPPYLVYEALQNLLHSLPEEERQAATSALQDLEAEYRIQKGAWLEHTAKQHAYDQRFMPVVQRLEDLLQTEPGNQEALFDLAQAQCSLGLCDQEAGTYRRLLRLDPTHNLAGYALKRHEIRASPALNAGVDIWDEEGYGDLAQMTRGHSSLEFELPITCQHRLTLASHGFWYRPKRHGDIRSGYGQSLGYSGVFNEYFSFAGEIMSAWYDGAPDDAITGNAALRLNAWDWVVLRAGYDRRQDFANGWAMDEGVMVDSAFAEATTALWRRLELQLGYEHMFYSDGNDQRVVDAGAKVLLSDHPRTLSLEFGLTHRHTRQESEYHYDQNELTGITHPYWTPRHYLEAAGTLRWRHDLAEFLFCGSRDHYYDIAFSTGTDTDNNPFMRGEAAWHWEFLEGLTWDIQAMLHHSDQWKGRSLRTGLSWRF